MMQYNVFSGRDNGSVMCPWVIGAISTLITSETTTKNWLRRCVDWTFFGIQRKIIDFCLMFVTLCTVLLAKMRIR